jgi:ABC-2 type transport system permease protein
VARTEITSGKARVGIIIPPDYHDKRTRNEESKILVLIDGSDSTASAQALASVNGLTAQDNLIAAARRGQSGGIQVQPIILFNPGGRTANYIIPGLVAILLQIVAVILAAVAIVREREKGTLEQLLVTPIDPLGLMLGKLGPYLLVGLFETTLILFVMRFFFEVPIRGNLIFIYGISIIYLFALLALGLFISSNAQSQAQAQQQSQLFILPSIFLSGYIFPFEGLPIVLRAIGICLPATHMVAIMRGIILRGAGPMEMMPHVLALVAISFVLVVMSARRIRKMAA